MLTKLLLLTSGLQTLCNAEPWIGSFNSDDGTCSNPSLDSNTTLSKDACMVFQPQGSPQGGRVGGSWGDLTTISAYEDTNCLGQLQETIVRKGREDGFCVPLSDLTTQACEGVDDGDPCFWNSVVGSGVEPQAVEPPHDSPRVSHND